jgi:hypothetical protein
MTLGDAYKAWWQCRLDISVMENNLSSLLAAAMKGREMSSMFYVKIIHLERPCSWILGFKFRSAVKKKNLPKNTC